MYWNAGSTCLTLCVLCPVIILLYCVWKCWRYLSGTVRGPSFVPFLYCNVLCPVIVLLYCVCYWSAGGTCQSLYMYVGRHSNHFCTVYCTVPCYNTLVPCVWNAGGTCWPLYVAVIHSISVLYCALLYNSCTVCGWNAGGSSMFSLWTGFTVTL